MIVVNDEIMNIMPSELNTSLARSRYDTDPEQRMIVEQQQLQNVAETVTRNNERS